MVARFDSLRVVLPLCCIALGLHPQRAESQPGLRHFNVRFTQLVDADGGFQYEVQFGPTGFGRPQSSVEWTAPDGRSATGYGPSFEDHDFTTFGENVFGTWQLELHAVSNQPAERYTFELLPFSLDSVFSELATITSPVDGSWVPLDFDLAWEFAGGATTSGRSVSYSSDGVTIEGRFADNGEPLYHVNATFDSERRTGEATFRAGSVDLNPTQVIGDAAFIQQYSPHTIFRNLSAPATFRFRSAATQLGDTNSDGLVNVDDLNNVRNNFGAVGRDDGTLEGDAFPFDGFVNIDDLNAVRNHFGAGATAVPEPTAFALAWLASFCLFARRR